MFKRIIGHIVVLGVVGGIISWKVNKENRDERREEAYIRIFKQVNSREYKELNKKWRAHLSPSQEPDVLFAEKKTTYTAQGRGISGWWASASNKKRVEQDEIVRLWEYYAVNECCDLIDTKVPDAGAAVFGSNGEQMPLFNSLLAVQLAIAVDRNKHDADARNQEVLDQLKNYESVCAKLQRNSPSLIANAILDKALAMKDLRKLCKLATNDECDVCNVDFVDEDDNDA